LKFIVVILALTVLIARATPTSAPRKDETGYNAWLRYDFIEGKSARSNYDQLPATVVALDDLPAVKSSQAEFIRGVRGMLGRRLRVESKLPGEDAVLLGTFGSIKNAIPSFVYPADFKGDGYILKRQTINGRSYLIVAGPNENGVLYGTFALLRKMGMQQS